MTEILDPPQARIRQKNTILDLFPTRDRFRRKHIQSWIPSHREPGSGGKPYNPGPHHRETEHPKLSLQNSQLCLRCRCVVALFLCCWLSTSCAEAPCGELGSEWSPALAPCAGPLRGFLRPSRAAVQRVVACGVRFAGLRWFVPPSSWPKQAAARQSVSASASNASSGPGVPSPPLHGA